MRYRRGQVEPDKAVQPPVRPKRGHRIIEHFATYEEALAWAIESSYIEKTRFLVRLDAGRKHYSDKPWEAIQSWLRNL